MLEVIGAMVLTWWFFGGMCIFSLFAVHSEWEVFSFLSVVGIATLAYFLFDLTIEIMGWLVLGYIPIGMGWAIWRWRKHCKKNVEEFNKTGKESH